MKYTQIKSTIQEKLKHLSKEEQAIYLKYLEQVAREWPKESKPDTSNILGESYWFFRTPSEKDKVKDDIIILKEWCNIPRNIELLVRDEKEIKLIPHLKRCLNLALSASQENYPGNNYCLQATCQGMTGRQVKSELSKIITSVIDWDQDNSKIFQIHSIIGESYIKIGNRMIEYNH